MPALTSKDASSVEITGLTAASDSTPRAVEDRLGAARPLSIAELLYDRFSNCDAEGVAACLTDDVRYEDLLLGGSTLATSRDDIRELIKTHPVFVYRGACDFLGVRPPQITIKVDGISEDQDRGSVGVEWHVEVDGEPLALGRGISFLRTRPARQVVIFPPLFVLACVAVALGYVNVIVSVAFFDKSTMYEVRSAVDLLDDFRDSLDLSSLLGAR
ncbi:unnamed protein product [Prorocentrum cordatum]|uniref:SnoaL-like domain-containing protein n=1 Tax=Prorocentrum cordatum TaxID=2364126 RepID=A0ABN9PD64_9DINO|nr:unnamed protein product [Polarella glacialis]